MSLPARSRITARRHEAQSGHGKFVLRALAVSILLQRRGTSCCLAKGTAAVHESQSKIETGNNRIGGLRVHALFLAPGGGGYPVDFSKLADEMGRVLPPDVWGNLIDGHVGVLQKLRGLGDAS